MATTIGLIRYKLCFNLTTISLSTSDFSSTIAPMSSVIGTIFQCTLVAIVKLNRNNYLLSAQFFHVFVGA